MGSTLLRDIFAGVKEFSYDGPDSAPFDEYSMPAQHSGILNTISNDAIKTSG